MKKLIALFLTAGFALLLCAADGRGQNARQIRFAKNSTSAIVSGRIVSGREVIYLIAARRGQTLEFDVADRSANNDVVAEIFAPGRAESLTGADYGKQWKGKLPRDGVYRIRVGTIESANAEFKLRVTIK